MVKFDGIKCIGLDIVLDGELIGLMNPSVFLKQILWEIFLIFLFLHGALLLARPVEYPVSHEKCHAL